ncbi:hypothetical protein BH10ACI2_BH10ACI2_00140 [soil metagenome]
MSNSCRAYKCDVELIEGHHTFCQRHGYSVGEDIRRELVKTMSKYGRGSTEYLKIVNRVRPTIARWENCSEIEIDQFQHHDQLLYHEALKREVEREKKKFAEMKY